MAHFARYFNQEVEGNVRADVDLVIRLSGGPDDAAPAAKRVSGAAAPAAVGVAADALHLASFPAHNFILDTSSYFEAQQGKAWQHNRRGRRTASSSSAARSSRPTVYLTIDSAEQLTAAEAVIQAMYGVPGAISSLEQQQLVYAVVIADMLDVQAAAQQAQEALTAAAASEQGLAAAALQVLADLAVWPACLLPLLPVVVAHAPCCADDANLAAIRAADPGSRVQGLLVAALGDLQAVWADADLVAMLLQLPLPAMQLLLRSSRLRVPSADTVLFTARRYVQAHKGAAAKAAATKALAPLIRAPHLSGFALSLITLPECDRWQLLSAYQPELRRLQQLKLIASPREAIAEVQEWDGVPASWCGSKRVLKPLEGGVRLEWRLPVEQLKQACKQSFTQQDDVRLHSPGSPPLGGVAWEMLVVCKRVGCATQIGLNAGPAAGDVPAGGYCKFKATVTGQDVEETLNSPCLTDDGAWGFNYALLQVTADGGWDEAFWAAAGLPAAGEILLQMHVHSVG